jgi:medium-chain acyl-[acyl-carrier-protein] hydrolase
VGRHRSSEQRSKWVAGRPGVDGRLQLFCFPYAGAGTASFASWQRALPEIVVRPIRLPGRESRLAEPAFTSLHPLVERAAEALAPELEPPFAFFGHSMGAIVSFELARRLRRLGRPGPRLVVVSAERAPHVPLTRPPIYHLPEDEFLAAIERFGGTPPAVLAEPELLALIVDTLRADLSITDTYEFTPEPALECPIAIFGGRDDTLVPEAALAGWREHTTRPEGPRLVEGGHFFVHEHRDEFLAELAEVVRRHA